MHILNRAFLFAGSCSVALPLTVVTALAQDATATEDPVDAAFRAIAVNGGISVMNLPDLPTGSFASGAGTFEPNSSGLAVGPTLGVNVGGVLGKSGEYDVIGGFSVFGSLLHSGASGVDTFTGPGTVVVQSYSPGTGNIALTTTVGGGNAAGNSTLDMTDAVGDTKSQIVNVGATAAENAPLAIAFTVPGGNGVSLASVAVHDGTSAAAYGALMDTNGFVFIGVGDLTGLTVTTKSNETIFYAGGEATIGLAGQRDERTYVQAYVGPTYRHLGRNVSSTTTIDIPEVAGTTTIYPELGINRTEDLRADYLGALVGASFSQIMDSGILLSLTAEGGAYAHRFNYTGSEVFTLGTSPTLPGGASYNSTNGVSEQMDGGAWFARAQTSVSMGISKNTTFTLGGSVEYLSKTPSITRTTGPAPTFTGTTDATYTAVANTASNSHISFADMWNIGVTASWTTQF